MTTPRNLAYTFCLILAFGSLCSAQGQDAQSPTAAAPVEPAAATTGSGTAGKIAKFTAATVLGDSIMTEKSAKIGVNSATPVATLHVVGSHPPTQATQSGLAAANLLQTGGGKGGDTGAAGKTGGKGAGILLAAGPGGNAPAGGTNGAGGSIFLEPGAPGTGGTGGASGNVLMAEKGGAVGVGTIAPTAGAKLHAVNSASGPASDVGVILGENKNSLGEFNIGVRGLSHYGTGVWGNGATAGVQGYGATGVFGSSSSGSGVSGASVSGNGVRGNTQGASVSGVFGQNTGAGGVGVTGIAAGGKGVYGQSNTSSGVFGFSGSGDGVRGQSSSGYAGNFLGKAKVTGNFEVGGSVFFGSTTRQMLNLYNQTYGIGVQASTFYFRTDYGFRWYKGGIHSNTAGSPGGGTQLMNLSQTGDLFVTGPVHAPGFIETSDRHAKANFSSVNPRAVLDKLAAVPVQTWNYKGEPDAVRHMGPMAQDFRAAFQLGADDRGINTVDAAGVTMAAVQGLYQLSQEKDKRIERLTQEAEALRSEVDELKDRLRRLEEAVRGQQK